MVEPSYLDVVREMYDTVAVSYAEILRDELVQKPFDRAVLALFAELVARAGGGPVADLGCGPGRVAAHLHSLGMTISGIDVSPAMIEVARRDHPQLRFAEGSITALDFDDGELRGAVAWYSIIHTPPALLPTVFGEFHRVLAPGGLLLLAFQVGDEQRVHLEQAYGHTVSLDVYRRSPDLVVELVRAAGFVVQARVEREPDELEKSRQAYVIARKPGAS